MKAASTFVALAALGLAPHAVQAQQGPLVDTDAAYEPGDDTAVGSVFLDLNRNGRQDFLEPGIRGVSWSPASAA
jgi:hypothetical protein